MNPGPDILVLSNGHGEDEIGRIILDRLVRSDAERRLVAAWATGRATTARASRPSAPRTGSRAKGSAP